MTYCVWSSGHLALTGEDPDDVRRTIEEAIALAEAAKAPFLLYMAYLAKATADSGWDLHETVRHFASRCLEVIGHAGRMIFLAHVYYFLALASLELADRDTAEFAYRKGLALVPLTPAWHVGRYEYLRGRLLAAEAAPDLAGAAAAFERAIAADQAQGVAVPAAQTRYWLARVQAERGDLRTARAGLRDLEHRFEVWGIPVWARKCARAPG